MYGKSLINWKILIFKQDLFWNSNKICGATMKCKCVLTEKNALALKPLTADKFIKKCL